MSCVSVLKKTPVLGRYEYERPEMGVPFRIVLYAPDRACADQAAEAAFRRVQELNDIMSDYDAESELSKLSRTSGQGRASPSASTCGVCWSGGRRWRNAAAGLST